MTENVPMNGPTPEMDVKGFAVALIGCGYWGRNYARVLMEEKQVKRVVACDTSWKLLEEISMRHESIECVQDLDIVVKDKTIDACIVATPPISHHGIVKRLIDSGKHVLVEKPFTTCSFDGQDLIDSSKQKNRVLMVGHTFLFNESVRALCSLVKNKETFGDLYYFHATRTNLGPVRKDVNVMWDLAAHDISVFIYIMNQVPIRVSATAQSVLGSASKQCDVAFLTLYFPNNKLAHIHVSWCEPNKVRKIVAVGSKARVEFDDMNKGESIRVFNSSVSINREDDINLHTYADQVCFKDGDIHIPHIKLKEPLKSQVGAFIDGIQQVESGRACDIVSPAELGKQVVQVLEAADLSLQQHGASVAVGEPESP